MDITTHLDSFLKDLIKPNALVEDIMKYITKTQQNDAKYIGKIVPGAQLNGVYNLIKRVNKWDISIKPSSNKLMKDCIIKLYNKDGTFTRIQCRLIKELAPRKADINGDWGINIASFKLLK